MKSIQLGVQGNLRRFVVAILTVTLAMALSSCALFLRGSVTSTITGVVNALVNADAIVKPVGSDPADLLTKPKSQQRFLDAKVTAQLSVLPEVRATYPMYIGPVVLSYRDGRPVSSRIPSYGIPADKDEVGRARLVEGEYPATPTEIALEEATAKSLGMKVGDEAGLIANGNTIDPGVKITGIVSYDSDLGGAFVVILSPHVARALFAPSSLVPMVAVRYQDAQTNHVAANQGVLQGLDTTVETEVVSGKELRNRTITTADSSFMFLSYLAWIFAFLCLLIGTLLMASIYAAAGRDKAEQMAVLTSLGSTRGQMLGWIVRQGLVISAIGAAIGIVAGAGLSLFFQPLVRFISGMRLSFGVPWVMLLICFVATVGMFTFGAWWGSRKSVSLSTAELLRGPLAGRGGVGWVRAILGVLLVIGGGAGVGYALFMAHNNTIVLISFIAFLVGIILMAPLLLLILMPIVAAPLRLVSWVSARFAKKNARRSARRAGNIASVFMVGFAVATAGLLLTGSAHLSGKDALERDIAADYVITGTYGYVPDQSLTGVRQILDARVLSYGLAPARVVSQDHYLSARVLFGSPDTFAAPNETLVVDGAISGFYDGAAVSEAFAAQQKLHVGDSLRLAVAPGTPHATTITVPVKVIIDSQFFADVLIPTASLIEPIPGHARAQFMSATTVLVRSNSDQALREIESALTKAQQEYPDLIVQSRSDFLTVPDPQVTLMRGIVLTFVAVCTLAAMITLATMLGNSVLERRRETAVLKAGGATKGQLRRMVSFESVLISATSALVGIGFGAGLAFVISQTLPGWTVNWTSIPVWLWVVGLFILAHLIGLLAGIPAARQAGETTLVHEQ
ncbi:MAG: FtsX-like permease family protein [Propionibacteriaceae bacterium]|nr:FtsX-like permease family protein [Propionibacteriaceae bacterium]